MQIPFRNFKSPESVERWTKSQEPIAEEMINSSKSVLMLSAPTGLGKSLICAMVARYTAPIINYVCSDKALQNQLLEDFPSAVVLKGRGNYVCNLFTHLNADSCVGKCDEYTEGTIACNYYDQKDLMLASDFRILNTHYLLYEMNYAGQLKGQTLIILDEADTLDLLFIGFVSLQVTDKQVSRYHLGPLPKITIVESWIEWAGKSIDKLKTHHDIKHAKHALDEKYIKANKLIKKLELFLLLVEDDWIYNRHDTYSEFKPVWITKDLINKYLFIHSQRFILCSASLPPKAVICDTLQIPVMNCDYIEVGSSFKPENRKVYFDPIMDMSYKNRDKYYVMMDAIKAVMDKYPDVKGIIHCNSYVLGKQIMEIGDIRLMSHDSKNKDEMLKLFMESDKPIVFVSPSCMRGLSLKDDLARFGICVKMPFLNTQDKAISARLYGSGQRGKKWYNSEAGQLVLQMAGRHVRSHTDYGDFWILDSCFNRVKRTLPEWFTEHIIQDFDYGDDDEEEVKEAKAVDVSEEAGLMAPDSGDDWDDDEPTPIADIQAGKQAVFNKNMTVDDHTQERAPQTNTPDVVDKTPPVVKDEDYYDY
ncbi:MAG: helicase C-terminal domain-containing protein [Methylococcaceae bacterium]